MFAVSMTNNISLKNLAIEAIVSFNNKANEMTRLLAKKYGINLNEDPQFSKLRFPRIAGRWKGDIDENWNYWFHGSGCDFQNTATGQFIYIRINEGNYGVIDNYYVYKYIITSKSLEHITGAIPTYEDFNLILNELENDGLLVDIGDLDPRYKSLVLSYTL
jgi:hypothetical protein